MTIDELIRLMESKRRVYELKLKEKANFDYTLADLIGRSVARVYNSSNHMPDISEAYPSLFSSTIFLSNILSMLIISSSV